MAKTSGSCDDSGGQEEVPALGSKVQRGIDIISMRPSKRRRRTNGLVGLPASGAGAPSSKPKLKKRREKRFYNVGAEAALQMRDSIRNMDYSLQRRRIERDRDRAIARRLVLQATRSGILRTEETPADGSCFFHALARALTEMPASVRKSCMSRVSEAVLASVLDNTLMEENKKKEHLAERYKACERPDHNTVRMSICFGVMAMNAERDNAIRSRDAVAAGILSDKQLEPQLLRQFGHYRAIHKVAGPIDGKKPITPLYRKSLACQLLDQSVWADDLIILLAEHLFGLRIAILEQTEDGDASISVANDFGPAWKPAATVLMYKTLGIGKVDAAAHFETLRWAGKSFLLPSDALPLPLAGLADTYGHTWPHGYMRLRLADDTKISPWPSLTDTKGRDVSGIVETKEEEEDDAVEIVDEGGAAAGGGGGKGEGDALQSLMEEADFD